MLKSPLLALLLLVLFCSVVMTLFGALGPRGSEAAARVRQAASISEPWQRFLATRGDEKDAEDLALRGSDCGTSKTALGAHLTEQDCDAVHAWWSAQSEALNEALRAHNPRAYEYAFVTHVDAVWDDERETVEPGATAQRQARASAEGRAPGHAQSEQRVPDQQQARDAGSKTCAPFARSFTLSPERCSCSSETPSSSRPPLNSQGGGTP
ncbi:MAG: hypothetical protein JWN04_5003 [Myxococcaceae bacterium]|nr:hypothetical protein [Myxococcaceae bacterium]